jgi:hypothetical protein
MFDYRVLRILLVLFPVFNSSLAFAWWDLGHEVVAAIASHDVTSTLKKGSNE